MKVVIGPCVAGFALTHKAMMRYFELKGIKVYPMLQYPEIYEDDEEEYDLDLLDSSSYKYSTVPIEERGGIDAESSYLGKTEEERKLYNEKYNSITKHAFQEFCTYNDNIKNRSDPALIQVIEEFGVKASPRWNQDDYEGFEAIKIVEVPDDVEWYIAEDGETGHEHIAEKHRTWG